VGGGFKNATNTKSRGRLAGPQSATTWVSFRKGIPRESGCPISHRSQTKTIEIRDGKGGAGRDKLTVEIKELGPGK